jgi:hypothetical protein
MPFWKRGANEARQPVATVTAPRVERVLQGSGRVDVLSVTPDGSWVVSAGRDGTFNVWDLSTGALQRTFKGPEMVDATLTADGARMVSLGLDGKARIWELSSGTLERTAEAMREGAGSMALAPDGRRIVTCGNRKKAIEVWDLVGGVLERAIESPEDRWLHEVAVTPDGTRIVAGGSGEMGTFRGSLCVWDLTTGRLELNTDEFPDSVRELAVTPDGSWAVAGFDGTFLQARDLATGTLQVTMTTPNIRIGQGGPTPIPWLKHFAITSDGRRAAGAAAFNTVQVWDLATGRLVYAMKAAAMFGDSLAIAVSPDGMRVLVATDDAAIRVWALPPEAGPAEPESTRATA